MCRRAFLFLWHKLHASYTEAHCLLVAQYLYRVPSGHYDA